MLHYSVDNEIMADIYQDFKELKDPDLNQLHALGSKYAPLLESYQLDEKTITVINLLQMIESMEDRDELETKILHGHITQKADLRAEQAEYHDFLNYFDTEERRALEGMSSYVVGKKIIPYKIKNRHLHIDVIDTPAMVISLDFEDVLIEDGRHPREIMMTHLTGQKFIQSMTVHREDGTEEIVNETWYRIEFVNGLIDEPYQKNESSFVFRRVTGSMKLYNYCNYALAMDVNTDKLPWRLIMQPLQAVLEKIQILGVDTLNKAEIAALPVICVFFELIQFYLQDETTPGIGKSMIHYNAAAASRFAFSEADLYAVCEYLAPFEQNELIEWLEKANSNRDEFCRHWIQFASTKRGESFWHLLNEILQRCSEYYIQHPYPLAFRKHHSAVRRALNSHFNSKKWKGEFPLFEIIEPSDFLENVEDIYCNRYTYLNEKYKGNFIDFIEGMSGQSYVVTVVEGFALFSSDEEMAGYDAVNGYFLDGGRRRSSIIGQITIDSTMDSEQVEMLMTSMLQDILHTIV